MSAKILTFSFRVPHRKEKSQMVIQLKWKQRGSGWNV